MRLSPAKWVVLIGLLGAVGCGGDEDATTPPAWTADDFLAAFPDAFCNGRAACCEAVGVPHTDDTCRAAAGLAGFGLVFDDSSHGVFDPVAARDCLAQVVAWTQACAVGPLPPGPCRRLYAGTVEPGGACSSPKDCSLPSPEAQRLCTSGVCRVTVPVNVGAPCGPQGAGFQTNVCADTSAYCDMGTCASLRGADEACDDALACVAGLRCIDGTCGAGIPLDATCPGKLTCVEGAYCSGEGNLCRPLRHQGESCLKGSGEEPCQSGSICSSSGNTAGKCQSTGGNKGDLLCTSLK